MMAASNSPSYAPENTNPAMNPDPDMDNVLAVLQTEQDDPRIQMNYDYEILLNNTRREKIIENVKRRFEGGECVVPPHFQTRKRV